MFLILHLALPAWGGKPALDPLQRMAQQLAAKAKHGTRAHSHHRRHERRRRRRRTAHRRHAAHHHRKVAHRKHPAKPAPKKVTRRHAVTPKPPARTAQATPARLGPMALVHLQAGKDALTQMREALGQVQTELAEAQKKKNVVKVNCLQDKAARMKALLKISQGSQQALLAAYHQNDASSSHRRFTELTVARNEVDTLRTQASACVGQLAFRSNGSFDVQVEVPPQAPGGGPLQPQLPPPITIRPPPASPTL